jgi:UDPglucose--hexose-1-phosphate uridylyltransferase
MSSGARIRADTLRATESLYGPTRADRPSDVHGTDVVCPFCPGNEHLSGALLTPDPGPLWLSRVIANLYPAVVEPDGRHEVIVDLRGHDIRWSTLERTEIRRILHLYREREAVAYADGYVYAAIFKNSGPAAGASLRHSHAQVVALRSLPRSIAARLERLGNVCTTCEVAAAASPQTVLQTADFAAYVPNGSRTAFEVRIAPVRHGARLSNCGDATVAALADVLTDVMRRLVATLGEDLPFNVVLQSAPRDPRAAALQHWEIEVVPRVESFGGYELGTGGFLVSRTPEDAAAVLRAAEVTTDA